MPPLPYLEALDALKNSWLISFITVLFAYTVALLIMCY